MMPKPLEFKFDDKRVFVDRNETQQQFVDAYNNAKQHEDEYNIICYYGDGGIGKSELFYTLQENIRLNRSSSSSDTFIYPVSDKPIAYLTYDFGDSTLCDAVLILKRLRNKLNDTNGFSFPIFDLVYVSYLTSRGDGNDLNVTDRLHSFIGSGSWIENAIDIATVNYGFFGIIKPLADMIGKVKNWPEQFDEYKYKRKAEDILLKIEENENKPEELKKLLAITFSMDLAWNCEHKLDKPLVILLDTFEAYQNYLDNNPSETDWINEIITHSIRTLYVLLGRNECEYDGVKNFPLNNFDEKYTIELMNRMGIVDTELIKQVYSITGGLPYYISICVSNYDRLKKTIQNPTIDLIGATTSEMNQRYYKYLDEDEKRIVEIASLLGIFTYEDLLECCKDFFGPTFSEIKCNNVMSECIVKRNDENHYRVHDIAKKVFLENAEKNQNSYYPNMLRIVIKFQKNYIKSIKMVSNTPIGILNNCYDNILKLIKINPSVLQLSDISIMDSIAVFYGKLGNIESLLRTIKLFDKSLQFRQKELGEEHPDTLVSSGNLAVGYYKLGSIDSLLKAIKLDEKTLEVRKKVLGEEHPDTLLSSANLAAGYYKLDGIDNILKAIKLSEKTLEIRKRVLGEEHANTLSLSNNLAIYYHSVGGKDNDLKALKLEEKTLEIQKKVLGIEHPATLASMQSLASCYYGLDGTENFLKAKTLLEETLQIRKEVLGERHPDTLESMYSLAICYDRLGNVEDLLKAMELYEKTIEIREEILGESHPVTIQTVLSLAECCLKIGDEDVLRDVIKLYESAIEVFKKELGIDNPITLRTMNSLIVNYYKSNDEKNTLKAIKLNEEALDTSKKIMGDEHEDTLYLMKNLAAGYSMLKDDKSLLKSIELYEQSLEICKRVLGKENTKTINIMIHLADCYSNLNTNNGLMKAMQLEEETLEVAKRLYDEDDALITQLSEKKLNIEKLLKEKELSN